MSDWKKEYLQGVEENINEEFETARKTLEHALSTCPDNNQISSKIIFEIGRAMFGQGYRGTALSCMLTAVKMGMHEPYIDNMMDILVNEYGMPSMNTPEQDDAEAFKAVQVMRYLKSKKRGCFNTEAEKDMIIDLLTDAWREFSDSTNLKGLTARQKLALYRSCVIFFPVYEANVKEENNTDNIIYANFDDNLCSCGSGLPYMWCCGRIKTVEELSGEAL